MELTNELKARFEMLYYGQRVSMLHKPEGRYSDEVFKAPQILTGPNQSEYLSLRPLSSITEEEAIEVAKKLSPTTFVLNRRWIVRRHDLGGFTVEQGLNYHSFDIEDDGELEMWDNYHSKMAVSGENMLSAYDYLRSKRFLLPFMGIPSEQWVEWGVVKLKTA